SETLVGRTGVEPVTSCLSSASRRTEPTELYFIKDLINSLPLYVLSCFSRFMASCFVSKLS
ncbi:MAG TPA: hypothetical protein PK496_09610, partial [Bacteroidales bacterium]|nr:hypothetical protein [Bacteroidales bacterium]